MGEYISGIQQIGIGVKDAPYCLRHYARLFGMDTLLFDDVSDARLMKQYTGGYIYKRHALLSLNMQGGGGFELWQFQDRKPLEPARPPAFGDIGIYAAKLKTSNVLKARQFFLTQTNVAVSALHTDAKSNTHFFVKDAEKNVFDIIKGNHWFQQQDKIVGGVTGAVIGVSDMEKSIHFYKTLLNFNEVTYDYIDTFSGFNEDAYQPYRKVLLQKEAAGKGAFSKLLGPMEIELVQCHGAATSQIFENRFWGDCGFIHLCFDVFDMCGLKEYMEKNGYGFTVDSLTSFDMEKASGRFCYIEDPDGTLIELVETHKVPMVKKLGLNLNLKKRNPQKPLPDWMIKLLSFNKIR
jgi:catechol 2,3-dioxygenase-like lactoylglutathione lyase family enzyme